MLFIKKNKETDEAPKTKKEKLGEFGRKVEKFVDNNPLTAVAIACGTVHVASYTLLYYATKPPTKTVVETEA